MTGLLLGTFALTILWASFAKKDYFSPVRLYVIVYSLFLGINSLNLSRLQAPWSLTTHLFFWGASFLFIGAGTLVLLLDATKGGKGFDFAEVREALRRDAEAMDWRWFYGVFLFCSLVYLGSYLGATVLFGTIPLLAKNPDTARVAFNIASLPTNIGLFFGPLSLMLGAELVIFGRIPKAARVSAWMLMGFMFVVYLTVAMRLDLFRFCLFGLLLFHYGRRRLGMREFAVALGLGVVLFVGIFLLRTHSNAAGELADALKVRLPRKYIWASQIYGYVASNFWNMDYGFSAYEEGLRGYPQSWGFELFRPLMFLLQLEGPLQASYGFDSIFNDSVLYVRGLNSTVYLWHFYKDFGAFGVFFLTFAAGLAFSIFYRNFAKAPTLFRLSLWGIFAGILVFSVTAALWEFWFTHLNLLVFVVAHRKFKLV